MIVVTVKHSTRLNLNSHSNRYQMNKKDLNTVGKKITNLAESKKLLNSENKLIPRKIKETIHSLKDSYLW